MMYQWWHQRIGDCSLLNNNYHLFGLAVSVLVPLMVWALAWKGLALWHAARRGEKIWFVVLLVVNTVGLLEIFYLIAIAKAFAQPEQKK